MKSRVLLTSLMLVLAACSSGQWDAESVTRAAVADLAQRMAAPESDVVIVTPAHPVTWTNGAIGCAEPGQTYAERRVEGYSLVLGFVNQTYSYHQGGDDPPFFCPAPSE